MKMDDAKDNKVATGCFSELFDMGTSQMASGPQVAIRDLADSIPPEYQHRLQELDARIADYEDLEKSYWNELHPGMALNRGQLLADINGQIQDQLKPSVEDRSMQLILVELQRLLRERATLLDISLRHSRYRSAIDRPRMYHYGGRSHAVVIGIDDYTTFGFRLQGCVNDANLIYEYLASDLGVPESQVTLLTSNNPDPTRQPTRQNILAALYTLRDNPDIKFGDNLVVFFAGHGSRYRAPKHLTPPGIRKGRVEALCPMDRGCVDGESVVLDISDRELNIIISEIRASKGPNIRIIVDACHSGGMSRAMQEYNVRAENQLQIDLRTLLLAADQDTRRTSTKRALSNAWVADLSGCVYMAACQPHEQAHEHQVGNNHAIHGIFTYRLVSSLRRSAGNMTYADLEKTLVDISSLESVEVPPQSIHFDGDRKGCRLWSVED